MHMKLSNMTMNNLFTVQEVQPVVEKQKTKQKAKTKALAQKAVAQKEKAQKEKKREKLRIPVERGKQRMVE